MAHFHIYVIHVPQRSAFVPNEIHLLIEQPNNHTTKAYHLTLQEAIVLRQKLNEAIMQFPEEKKR